MRKLIRWIAVGFGACMVLGVIAALNGGGKTGTPTATPGAAVAAAQPAAVAQQVAVRATDAPKPTAAPLTPEQQLGAIAESVLGKGKLRTASLLGDVALIEYDQGTMWDEAMTVKMASQDFRQVAPKVFEISGINLLTVRPFQTFTDVYGKDSQAAAMGFTISRAVASKVAWKNVDPRNFGAILQEKECSLYVHPALKAAYSKWAAE